MINIDVVCPLFKAEKYIENLIKGINSQTGVKLNKVVFAVTEWDGMDAVIERISSEQFTYFTVKPEQFSHSLTRQKAIYEYCESDIVIMISQDVVFADTKSLYELAKNVSDKVVYAYGKQVCNKKNIEYYIRKKNYRDKTEIISDIDIEELQLRAFFASDAFSAYYRPAFIELNGYDNIKMMMNEDMYYAKKVLDNGYYKAYIATAIVEHSHKFTLKQLYKRYFQTGEWFAEHPEFDNYRTTDTGLKLALYILGQALKHFNIPVLIRWLPDMAARYLGLRNGKKVSKKT